MQNIIYFALAVSEHPPMRSMAQLAFITWAILAGAVVLLMIISCVVICLEVKDMKNTKKGNILEQIAYEKEQKQKIKNIVVSVIILDTYALGIAIGLYLLVRW